VLRLRQSGSEALVKAWLEGNWDIVDGAYFKIDEAIHVKAKRLYSFAPPTDVRFRSFDWGSARPFSVGWWVICSGNWPENDPFPLARNVSVTANGMALQARTWAFT
jgi:hypothetical protein